MRPGFCANHVMLILRSSDRARSLTCTVSQLLPSLSLSLAGVARATALEDAVAAYNSSAAGIETLWDDFQDKQSLAFDDVNGRLSGMHDYFYWSGLDNDAADDAWAAMEAAIEHLQEETGPDVQPSLELLLTLLDDAASKLEAVIAADALDSTAKAYVSGADKFDMPSQPFVFWTDTDQPNVVGWVPFDFPSLAVGNNLHTSYVSNSIGDFIEFIDTMWDWIEFGLWLQRHYDDAYEMQQDAKDKLDDICGACASFAYAQVADDCFTAQSIEEYCTTEGWADEMCGSGYSADDANKELSTHWPCFRGQNVQRCADAAQDYVTSSWQSEIPWL